MDLQQNVSSSQDHSYRRTGNRRDRTDRSDRIDRSDRDRERSDRDRLRERSERSGYSGRDRGERTERTDRDRERERERELRREARQAAAAAAVSASLGETEFRSRSEGEPRTGSSSRRERERQRGREDQMRSPDPSMSGYSSREYSPASERVRTPSSPSSRRRQYEAASASSSVAGGSTPTSPLLLSPRQQPYQLFPRQGEQQYPMYQERQSGERSPVSERGDLGRLGGAGMVMGEFPGMEEVLMSNNSAPITSANPEVVKQDLVMFEETEIVDDEEVEFHISAPTGVSVGPPSPVSTRHGPLEPEKGIQEEQPHQPEKKNNDVDEVEEHLQHSSLGSTLQQTDQNLQQTQENLSQERQIDLDIDTEENTSAPVSLAISNEIHSPSFPSELTEESTQSHLAPETTPALASSGASEAAGLGFSVSAATIALSAGYKKKQDSKEQQEALKAQEDAKIEELKKTIAELQRQELEIIQSIRGVGTPSEIISRRIQQLHEYNEIKDVGQVILGKCAELEGTTIKKQYENFGLDTDD